MVISAEEHPKKSVEVHGRKMSYVEMGEGDPIVFLHGNPTSSYLWRNVMPHVKGLGRCIAPDLIGMGDSEKLPDSGPDRYRFVEHRQYLDGLLEALGVTRNAIFVIHDWGSALGFDWANRHREAMQGIAYMEGIVRPVLWEEWNEASRPVFEGFRSPAGEEHLRGEGAARLRAAWPDRCGDGCLSPSVCRGRGRSPPDAYLATPDSDLR